jgi:hypothetical protein
MSDMNTKVSPEFQKSLLTWAKFYTQHGFRLTPLPYKVKHSIVAEWPKRASNDYDTVANWIKNGYPQDLEGKNIFYTGGLGIVTGQGSGVTVLDVDGKEGHATLAEMTSRYGEKIPKTPTQKTPGGVDRYHVFFRYWGKCLNAVKFAPGLDIRSDGGMVVAAPSIYDISDVAYTWVEGFGLDDLEIAECPEWLKPFMERELLWPPDTAGAKKKKPQTRTTPVDEAIPEGARDQTLTSMAGTMRRKGFSEAAIEVALLETNQERCQPPLPDDQVRKIARSIGAKPAGNMATKATTDEAPKIEIADMYTAVEADPTPVEWIGGLFPRGQVTMMFGKQGCGKTLFLGHLTHELSIGGTVMNGILTKNEPARKVIFFEGDVGANLFRARKHEYGWIGNEANLKHIFQNELDKKGVWLDLAIDEEGYIRRIFETERPDLVIFDTLQCFHSLDENKAVDMKLVMRRLVTAADTFNCAVTAIHHARKGDVKFKTARLALEDAQGSNMVLRRPGAIYTIERIKRDDKGDVTTFSLKKDWNGNEQDDFFGYTIQRGFYDERPRLMFESFPAVGDKKTDIIRHAILSQTRWFSCKDIVRDTGTSPAHIKRVLASMAKGTQIETKGFGRSKEYRYVSPWSQKEENIEEE